MPALFEAQFTLLTAIYLVLLVVKVVALVDAAIRPSEAYRSADKLTKPAWLLILGLSLVVHLLIATPISLLSLLGTVASFVYLADVRPAVRGHRGAR